MSSTAYTAPNQGRHDPLRRFTSTPHAAQFTICGRTIRFETNSGKLFSQASQLFEQYSASVEEPQFLWKIVVQSSPETVPPWPRRCAFSDGDLRYFHFGQSNFVAVDLNRRQAVAYLSQGLADDPLGFVSPFLDELFSVTAASLGFTTLFAACIGSSRRGVIVMAAPNNGKTTASYIAAKKGLKFYADRAVFLEIDGGRLRGWGDFWPAAFRSETLQFLPELVNVTQRFHYRDFTFHYFDKRVFQPARTEPIIPVCCVFLRRGVTAEACLTPVSGMELRLAGFASFHEDRRFHTQTTEVFDALAGLPAYELAYGEDPAAAAEFFPLLLNGL